MIRFLSAKPGTRITNPETGEEIELISENGSGLYTVYEIGADEQGNETKEESRLTASEVKRFGKIRGLWWNDNE